MRLWPRSIRILKEIMNTLELLELLKRIAKEYRQDCVASLARNRHMNQGFCEVDQKTVDAILVDFINKVGTSHSVDYALYTKDLS